MRKLLLMVRYVLWLSLGLLTACGRISLTTTSLESSSAPPPSIAAKGLVASLPSGGSVKVEWKIESDDSSLRFQLLRRPVSGGADTTTNPFKAIDLCQNLASLSCTDTDVVGGTAYEYKVQAVNSGGLGPLSDAVTITPMAAFSMSSIDTLSPTSIKVNFGASTGASSYSLHWGTQVGVYSQSQDLGGATSGTLTGLTAGNTYYIQVKATNSSGSVFSREEKSFTVPAVPTQPILLTELVGQQVDLSWTASSGGSVVYDIYRSTVSGSLGSAILTGSLNTVVTDATGTPGTVYYYTVRARNDAGTADSVQVSAKTISPFSPSAVTVNSVAGSVQLTWSAVTGADTYSVVYGTSSGSYGTTASANASSPYSVTGLSSGSTYYLRIRGSNTEGLSGALLLNTTEIVATILGSFSLSALTPGDQSMTVSWGSSGGAIGYTVKYGTNSGSYGTTASTNATSPLTITGLSNGTTYYVMVTANGINSTRDATAEISTTPFAPASAPTLSRTLTTGNRVDLSWTDSGGTAPVTYTVFRSLTSGSGYTALGSCTNLSVLVCNDSTVTAGTTYYYQVVVANYTNTAYSNEVSAVPIASFNLTSLTIGTTTGTLTWPAVPGATSYTLKQGYASGLYDSTTTLVSSPRTISTLPVDHPQYFVIEAVNAGGRVRSTNVSAS